MMRMSTRMKLGLVAASLIGVALTVVVNYTAACRLREVTLDDVPVRDWPQRFAMLDTRQGPGQSLDSLATRILADSGVYKVDLSWSLPHRLEISTNRFMPECFLLDNRTGRLFGVDDHGRVVPLITPVENWERPVLTGLTAGKMFERCADARVKVVVQQLRRSRDDHRDLYRLIEEIDFTDRFGLSMTVGGMPYRLKLRAETLSEDLDRFVQFITRYGVDLNEARALDFRFDKMVVCVRGKG